MINISKACSLLELDIPNVLDNQVTNIKVEGQYNCCPTVYSNEFGFVFPDEPCSWKANYFVNLALEDPRINLFSFEFSINGQVSNILEQAIDLDTSPLNVETTLQAWLDDNGYSQSTVNVTFTPETAEGFLMEITFTNLPNGVVPAGMIFVGEDMSCADKTEFDCVNNSDCVTYKIEYELANIQEYEMFSILYQDETGAFITVAFTDADFVYNPNAPVFPQTAADNVISQFTGDFNLSVSVINDVLTIFATSIPEGQKPISFTIREDTTYYQVMFNCSGFTAPISCTHVSVIETDGLENISSVLAFLDNNSAPIPITTESYTLDEISDLVADLKTWIVDNGYGNIDSQITYSYSDGINVDSLLTITFTDLFNTITPSHIILSTNHGDLSTFNIQCTEFTGVPDPDEYDSDKLLFTSNKLFIYPEFFSRSDTLPDGIYRVRLEIDYADEERTIEQYCVFVDCETKCKLINRVLENSNAYRWYEILKFGEECEECDCDSLCEIYEKLLNDLNESTEDLCRCSTC